MNQRKRDCLLKKSAAVITASAMVMAAPAAAMAEGNTYSDREKAALASYSESLADEWDESLSEISESADAAGNAALDVTLTVDETGQAMLGMITQMDFSWLKTIGLNMDATVKDGKEAVRLDALLNDAGLCTMNLLIDLMNSMEYIQIPELSQSYLKTSMYVTDEGTEIPAETLETYTNILSEPGELLPDGAVVSDLLNRYGDIVLDHVQEASSVEETVSVNGISEDCTLLEGQIREENALDMAKDILTTAQGDEQLEELLTKWSEAIPDAGDLNAQFQSFAEEALAELDGEETSEEDGTYLASRIWINEEEEVVGREIAVCEGIDTVSVFTVKAPKNEDNSALLVEVQSEGSGFALTGSGQTVDGSLDGSYSLAIDGITIAELAVENYNGNANGEGYPAGTITITFPQGEEEESYNPLSMFSLVVTLSSDSAEESMDLNLAVLSSGASLGSLNIHIVNGGDGVEAISEEDMAVVYDMMNEEEMNAYVGEISFDTILANAESAGVPADVLTLIEQSIENAMTGEEAAIDETLAGEEAEEISESIAD